MNIIDWNNLFSVNDKEVDDIHKKIFALINETYGSLCREELCKGESFNQLISFLRIHWKEEEKLLENMNYPDSEAHLQQHKKLSLIFDKVENQIDEDCDSLKSMLRTIICYVIEHITTQDKKLYTYIQRSSYRS